VSADGTTDPGSRSGAPRQTREVIGLGVLFGAFYFAQGIGEPTQGLIAQPVRWLLKQAGHGAADIGTFMALLGVPWMLKPIYGLLSDLLPIRGLHRRPYLVTCALLSALGLVWAWAAGDRIPYGVLLVALLVPSVGIAFSDVVVDALMVEKGQPLGLTGRLQSIQWACIYVASIGAGWVGGQLAGSGRPDLGFAICGGVMFGSGALAWVAVREEPRPPAREGLRAGSRALWSALRTPAIGAVAAFLLLWNFNPFSSTVLYLYMTQELSISEEVYGGTLAAFSAAAVVASLLYGAYCRRVAFGRLVQVSIALGVASTLAYWGLVGERSAWVISALVGFAYMTASLIQLDLAARICPPAVAGTVFATLMAVANFGISASGAVGGHLYETWSASWGVHLAFDALVAVGALLTAACWLLVPLLVRHGAGALADSPAAEVVP